MNLRKLWYQKLTHTGRSLESYLHLQLLIMLFSWPFLQYWGIPVTPAALIGNLLFGPLLFLFLLLSSLVFIAELVYLSHWPISLLLEWLTSFWWYLLRSGSRAWLFYYAHPPTYVTWMLPIIAVGSLLLKHMSRATRIILFLCISILAGCIIPRLPIYSITSLDYFDKELTLDRHGTQAVLFDNGHLGRRLSASKQISFSVIPHLVRHGITHLTLVLQKPSLMVFKAATRLIESFPVQTLYLPSFTGTLKNNGWYAWEQLQAAATKYQTCIILVSTPCTVSYGPYTVSLVQTKEVTTNGLTYYPLMVGTSPT